MICNGPSPPDGTASSPADHRPAQGRADNLTLHPQSIRDLLAVQVAIRGGRLDRYAAVRRTRMALAPMLARPTSLVRFSTVDGLVLHVPTWDLQQLVMARRAPLLPAYMAEAVRQAVVPGSLVVDGGANLGAFSLCAAACLSGRGTVVAFEPDPRNRTALKASVEANGFERVVTVVSAALAKEEGSLSFWLSVADGALSSLIQRSQSDRKLCVEAVALDSYLIEHFGAPKADVVKLDLEGGEALALEGMRQALPSVRLLVFEVNDPQLRRDGHDPVEIAAEFIRCGGFDRVEVASDHTGQVLPYDDDRLVSMLASEHFVNILCSR